MSGIYHVGVREVQVATYEVVAESEEEAIQKVYDGARNLVMTEYSHDMDSETWTAEKVW